MIERPEETCINIASKDRIIIVACLHQLNFNLQYFKEALLKAMDEAKLEKWVGGRSKTLSII